MRICRKCSKQISDKRTICRDCGGILEEVSDDDLLERETSEAPVDVASPDDFDARHVEETGDLHWKCCHCDEEVPETFDVCWNCGTTRNDQKAGQTELERFDEVADANDERSVEQDQRCAEQPDIEDSEMGTTVGDLVAILERFASDCLLGVEVVASNGDSVHRLELEEVAPMRFDPTVCEAAFSLQGGRWESTKINLVVLSKSVSDS